MRAGGVLRRGAGGAGVVFPAGGVFAGGEHGGRVRDDLEGRAGFQLGDGPDGLGAGDRAAGEFFRGVFGAAVYRAGAVCGGEERVGG